MAADRVTAAPQPERSPAEAATIKRMQEYLDRLDARALDFMFAGLAAIVANPDAASPEQGNSPFCSRNIPDVTVIAYGRRLLKYLYGPPIGLVLGAVLMARYLRATGRVLRARNFHRLMLTSCVVAAKSHFDVFYSNQYYAEAGGISNAELNRLELHLLVETGFAATATLREAAEMCNALIQAGSRMPIASNLVPVPLASLPLESVDTARDAVATAKRALLHADSTAPFASAARLHAAPWQHPPANHVAHPGAPATAAAGPSNSTAPSQSNHHTGAVDTSSKRVSPHLRKDGIRSHSALSVAESEYIPSSQFNSQINSRRPSA